jgi:hypothetical protein
LCILTLIVQEIDNASDESRAEINVLLVELLEEGINSITMTPSDAIRPLFDCIILCSGTFFQNDLSQSNALYVNTLNRIAKALLLLLKKSTKSLQSAYMLNEICALLFQHKLLREEYLRLRDDPECDAPIRDAFRMLIEMSGTHRPHINRAVLCQITVGWLGHEVSDKGLNAIPYRDDIVKLLLHKEVRLDESTTNQSKDEIPTSGVTEIPDFTNDLSVTRAFLMCFFAKLPESEDLNLCVKTELVHYVILALLKEAKPEKGTHPSQIMKGTPTYCLKMRAWQALCVLSRFVNETIAQVVCESVYESMPQILHNQIRYFMEIFIIRCSLQHPEIFGAAFIEDISRPDLSLQHISSLMIIGGNLILGRYRLDYFAEDKDKRRLKQVLAAVIPWLSSTQGFSRAIAQLLVYE